MPILSIQFFKWLAKPSGGLLAVIFIFLGMTLLNFSRQTGAILIGLKSAIFYVVLMLIVDLSRNITASVTKVYLPGGGGIFTLDYFYTDNELARWAIKRPSKDSFSRPLANRYNTIFAWLVFLLISLVFLAGMFMLTFLVYTKT